MSLEKMYSSRPFKAMAAFLFSVMVLSACQETAQVINKPAPNDVQNTSAVAKGDTFQQMTQEEQTLITQLADDTDMQFLADASRKMIVKMKLAISKDRIGFKYAMETKDSKAIIKALNFSDDEFIEFSKQRVLATQRWQAKFGSKKEMLLNMRSKYSGSAIQECTACNQIDYMKNIDANFDKIQSVNLPPTVKELRAMASSKQNAQVQDCFWFWEWSALVLGEAACVLAGALCIGADIAALILSGGALAPAEVAMVAFCGLMTAACMTAVYCAACHNCN